MDNVTGGQDPLLTKEGQVSRELVNQSGVPAGETCGCSMPPDTTSFEMPFCPYLWGIAMGNQEPGDEVDNGEWGSRIPQRLPCWMELGSLNFCTEG